MMSVSTALADLTINISNLKRGGYYFLTSLFIK